MRTLVSTRSTSSKDRKMRSMPIRPIAERKSTSQGLVTLRLAFPCLIIQGIVKRTPTKLRKKTIEGIDACVSVCLIRAKPQVKKKKASR